MGPVFKKSLVFMVLAALASLSVAMEPPPAGELKRLAKEGSLAGSLRFARELGNHKVAPRLVTRFQYNCQRLALEKRGLSAKEIDGILAPPPAWRGMPTKGPVKMLVLLIDFSDTPHIAGDTQEVINSRVFGDGTGDFPYESLRNFYRRSSTNQLEISGNVLGWYTTPYARSSVVEDSTGRETLLKEALSYYDSQGHDFAQYDNDGDGRIDYFAVIWAGTHGAWASFWWGYKTTFTPHFPDGSQKPIE